MDRPLPRRTDVLVLVAVHPENDESERVWVTWAEHIFFGIDPSPDTGAWASALYLLIGLAFLLTLPLVLRGLLFLHHAVAAAMLGRWPTHPGGPGLAVRRSRLETVGAHGTWTMP